MRNWPCRLGYASATYNFLFGKLVSFLLALSLRLNVDLPKRAIDTQDYILMSLVIRVLPQYSVHHQLKLC